MKKRFDLAFLILIGSALKKHPDPLNDPEFRKAIMKSLRGAPIFGINFATKQSHHQEIAALALAMTSGMRLPK